MATMRPEFAFKTPTPLLGAGGVMETLLVLVVLVEVMTLPVEDVGGVTVGGIVEPV